MIAGRRVGAPGHSRGGHSEVASSEASTLYPLAARAVKMERGWSLASAEVPGAGRIPSRISGTALVVES